MLSDFQRKKLTYFFHLLDDNKNGYLQLEDFSEIAEELCINLEYEFESSDHKFIVDKSVGLFYKLLKDIPHEEKQIISLEAWLDFFDKKLISNRNEELLDEYIELFIGFLFDLFDENHDGYISVDEYADLFVTYGIDIKYSAKSFVNLDINQDGKLSKNELIHAAETFMTSDDPSQKGNWIFGNWDSIERIV